MRLIIILINSLILFSVSAYSDDFKLEFEWGNIKKCNTGNPRRVDNPIFKLKSVPEGTVLLKFRMKDKNVPTYNHGGGKTEYKGNNTIDPGAFKYKSPCPPGRTHTYEWKVIAYDEDNKKLGSAVAQRKYPE